MRFGPVPAAEAEGAVLAHGLRLPGGRTLKKGRLLDAADVAALREAGRAEVIVARLDPGDVDEDAAARAVADAVAGPALRVGAARTGRCNLFATAPGLLQVDAAAIDALNAVDEAITLATLPAGARVEGGQLVATAKIIPFAVPGASLARAVAAAGQGALSVAPFRPMRAGLALTRLAGTRESLLDKAAASLAGRVLALGGAVDGEIRCRHGAEEVAAALRDLVAAGCDLLLVLGASSIIDRRDVVPAAVEALGGRVEAFGMPVDPGNLLLLGRVDGATVVGAPGCARSPASSGFDHVLERLAAGLSVGRAEIARLGVGGLLKEVGARGLPRHAPDAGRRLVALILAAGSSSRMGARNKLLAEVDGAPMVAHVVDAALASEAVAETVVVLGHEAERVRAALGGRPVTFVANPDHGAGMSTSVRAGLDAVAAAGGADAVIVCLGDMPWVRARHLDALARAFDPAEGRDLCVPTYRGKRGNPALLGARWWPEVRAITGDRGARALFDRYADSLTLVEVGDPGIIVDVDTEAALQQVHASARQTDPG